MNLSKDWLAFLDDGVARPSGHFAALPTEDENWKDPGALFSSFPRSTSLTKRLETLAQDFKGSGRYFFPDPAMRASREEMRQLVSVLANLGRDEGEAEDAAAIRAMRRLSVYSEADVASKHIKPGFPTRPTVPKGGLVK